MNTVLERRVAVPQLGPGRWLLGMPVALYAVLVLPCVFHDVVGEPDLERMVMGLIYGASSGLREAAGFHYNLEVSFGYYAVFYHLLPRSVLLSSSALIATINFLGYFSAVVTATMLALYFDRLFGVVVAVVTCMLFAFSPVFLDLGTSGHPQLPALALLLLGAWMLTFAADQSLHGAKRLAAASAACVASFAALTVRVDFVLAFPFIVLVAGDRELTSRRAWLEAAGLRAAVLLPAFVACLTLQQLYYRQPGGNAGFIASFFATFYRPDTIPRGLFVVVLCTGVASILAFLWLVVARAARALPVINALAILVLVLPSLAFWLPNSTPGRHLIFVTLGVALTIALLLTRSARPRWAIPAAVLLVISNQAIAEVSHNTLEHHYQWTFPQLTSRRATQSVPMGLFPLDHEAKQDMFILLRREGRAFARTCSGRVLAFAEEPHYLMISLVELDRSMRFRTVKVGDTNVFQARGSRCSVDFVEKAAAWHRDELREFLEAGYDSGWPIYFQESRRNPSDRTSVPDERRYCLQGPTGGACSPASAG
jgi:hypothetical protein